MKTDLDPSPGAGLAERLWSKFDNVSAFALYSPFFVCLAAGNLDSQTFNNCLAQELYFLQAFIQACDTAEKSKLESFKIGEKERFSQAMGIQLPKETVPGNAIDRYREFLLSIAAGDIKLRGIRRTIKIDPKDGVFTLAAIAPCMKLYSHLCQEIKAVIDSNDHTHIFNKWLHHNAYQIIQGSALDIERLMEFFVSSYHRTKFGTIESIYSEALKLNVELFSAQRVYQRSIVHLVSLNNDLDPRRVTIFCEFDMTVTAHDSSYNLMTATKPLGRDKDILSMYKQINKELEDAVEEIISNTPKANNFDYEATLKDELKRIWEHPKRLIEKVESMQLLKGFRVTNIIQAGRSIGLYNGCCRFLRKLVDGDPKTDVHIFSYSWCRDFILSALFSSDGASNPLFLHVLSNELIYDRNHRTTGRIAKNMVTPKKKLQKINESLNDRRFDENHLTVFIGHSVTDLPCLVEANIGILIGSNSCLRKLATHLGISFVPLFSGLVRKQKEVTNWSPSLVWKPRFGVLYTASCWNEIHAFVLGLDCK